MNKFLMTVLILTVATSPSCGYKPEIEVEVGKKFDFESIEWQRNCGNREKCNEIPILTYTRSLKNSLKNNDSELAAAYHAKGWLECLHRFLCTVRGGSVIDFYNLDVFDDSSTTLHNLLSGHRGEFRYLDAFEEDGFETCRAELKRLVTVYGSEKLSRDLKVRFSVFGSKIFDLSKDSTTSQELYELQEEHFQKVNQ